MPSVYQDNNLRVTCEEAMNAFLTFSPKGFKRWNRFQRALLERVFDGLSESIRAAHPESVIPPLKIYPKSNRLNGGDLYMDMDGIHVGEGLFEDLTFRLLQYAHFLMDNFIWQISPPMGDAPPLQDVVALEDFPAQALTFNAASLVPGVVSPKGFARSIGTMLLEWMQDLTFSGTSDPERLQADLSRRVIKPASRDLLMYNSMFEEEPTILLEAFENLDHAPYLRILFWQLLLDATYFLLSHELSHAVLGHTKVTTEPTPTQFQELEVQTDEKALQMMREVAGFLPNSLLMLFAFCSGQEKDVPLDKMNHPFSHDRLLHLAVALVNGPEGEAIHLNVNAGMTFLTTPLSLITMQTHWEEEGITETCDLAVHQYTDMDYNAHLLFYLERPPRNVPLADGCYQNTEMICQHTFQADLILRDRTHPDIVYSRGRVRLRPGGVADDMMFQRRGDRILTRLHVRIPAPAEWWLAHPNGEAVINSTERAPESLEELKDQQGNFRHNLRYEVSADFDHQRYIQELPESSRGADIYIRHRVLLAARRFVELGQPQPALAYFGWLYRSGDPLLQYPDQVDICQALLEIGLWEGLEAVARHYLDQAGGSLLPGFHVYLAACLQRRRDLQAALEHAFIEVHGIGNFGRFASLAQSAYIEIVQDSGDPVMELLRRFHNKYNSAVKVAELSPEKALEIFCEAREALQRAAPLARDSFLFLREYTAEVELDICRLEGRDYTEPSNLFQAIVAREPWFIPARIQLAGIALQEGDRDRARAIWLDARQLTPFLHHMVFDFHGALDRPNPKVAFTSRSVYDEEEPSMTKKNMGSGLDQ